MEGRDTKTVRVGGPRGGLCVHLRGDSGTPVLFVHGNGGRGSQWEAQIAALGTHCQVAALDLRGMGASDPPRNGDFSIGGFAEDVAAVADALAFQRFVLVGHSLGGSVIAACAGLFPERLLGLVFVDHGGDPRNDSEADLEALTNGLAPEAFGAFSRRALETCLKGARLEVKEQVLAQLRATPRAHFAGAVLGLLDFDAGAALRSYHGPKLHLHSGFLEAQSLTPIHGRVPGIEAILVRECSHWVHMDQPDLFNAEVDRFLSRHALNPAFVSESGTAHPSQSDWGVASRPISETNPGMVLKERSLTVAIAEESELEDIAELFHRIDLHYFGEKASARWEMTGHVKENLFQPHCGVQTVVAREDGRPIGLATFTILYPAPGMTGQLFMKDLFTIHQARGKGAGRAILQFLAKYALAMGCSRFDWTAEVSNPRAVAFYERLGVPRVVEKLYYRLTGEKLRLMAQGGLKPS